MSARSFVISHESTGAAGFRHTVSEFPRSPDYRFHRLLGLMALGAFLWFSFITWTQYEANLVFATDAGYFDFVCSSFRHGHFMRYPLEWQADVSYFASHFRPIFFLIAFLYFIADHAMTFLSFQNAALVFAVVPLCLYARTVLKCDWLALLVGVLYLTNHFVRSIHLALHPESMLFAGLFCMFLALERRSMWLYIAGFLWSVSIKEDIPLYLIAFGIFLLFEKDSFKRRMAIYTIPAAIVFYAAAVLSMQLAGAEKLHEAGSDSLAKFAELGDTRGEIALYFVTHPLEIITRLFRWPMLLLFLSTGLVALLDWRAFWLVIVGAGFFVASRHPLIGELHYYYSYAAVGFLFYSTVRGAATLQRWAGAHLSRPNVAPGLLFAVVVLVSLPIKTRTDGYPHRPFKVTPHQKRAGVMARFIPADAPVCVQYDLYAKVPNRPVKMPVRLENLPAADYVFMDFHPSARPADLYGPDHAEEVRQILGVLESEEFEIDMEDDGYVVYRRILSAGAGPAFSGSS